MKKSNLKLGSAIAAFILLVNVGSVAAVGPSADPTSGDIDATFNRVTVSDRINTMNLNASGSINTETFTSNLSHAQQISSPIPGGPINFPGTPVYNSLSAPYGGAFTINDDLVTNGDITVTEGNAIGRFISHTAGTSNVVATNDIAVGESTSATAICPENTYLSGCTGQIIDTSTSKDMMYLGSVASTSTNSCTSYITRTQAGTSTWNLASQAICFDPTTAAVIAGTAASETTGDSTDTGADDTAALLIEVQLLRDEMADLNAQIEAIDGAMDPMQTSLVNLGKNTAANAEAISGINGNMTVVGNNFTTLQTGLTNMNLSLSSTIGTLGTTYPKTTFSLSPLTTK